MPPDSVRQNLGMPSQGPWKKRLPQILDTLEALGRARRVPVADGEVTWAAA